MCHTHNEIQNYEKTKKRGVSIIVTVILAVIVAVIIGAAAGYTARKRTAEAQIGSAETEAQRIVAEARQQGETKKKEALLEAKEEIHRQRQELDRDTKERRSEIQRQETKGYARNIRRHIEKILFDEWAAGGKEGKSILEIEKYAQLLRNDCQDRISAFKEQIARLESEQDEQAQAIKAASVEWQNIGWLRDAITNASSKVFASYKTAKCNYYITATKIEAYQYAIVLLQEIIIELGNMVEGIQAMKNEMNAILEEVVKQAGSKCRAGEQQEDGLVKKYDPEKVHQLAKQYAINQELQSSNAAEIRSKMIQGLGEDGERTFANLYAATDYDTAIDIILDVCTKNARSAMEDTAKNDPLMLTTLVQPLPRKKLKTKSIKPKNIAAM